MGRSRAGASCCVLPPIHLLYSVAYPIAPHYLSKFGSSLILEIPLCETFVFCVGEIVGGDAVTSVESLFFTPVGG